MNPYDQSVAAVLGLQRLVKLLAEAGVSEGAVEVEMLHAVVFRAVRDRVPLEVLLERVRGVHMHALEEHTEWERERAAAASNGRPKEEV